MSLRAIVSLLVLSLLAGAVQAATNEERGSVAIVSSVNGDAKVSRTMSTELSDQPKFRGPIVYGDHLSTAKDATLGLLVAQNSLLTMRELSEVRIAEAVRNQQVLEVAKGRVCLAVSQPRDASAQPLLLRTPTSMITAAAGTLVSVEVEPMPQKSELHHEGNRFVILAAMRAEDAKESTTSVVETIHVVEGSVSIVSLPSGSSSTSLRTGQSLRIVGGVRGQTVVAPPVSCRAQEVQIVPVHTTMPPPAQQMMVQQQIQIAAAEPPPVKGIGAFSQVVAAGTFDRTIPGGLYVPYTGSGLSSTTPTTIQVTLPVELQP